MDHDIDLGGIEKRMILLNNKEQHTRLLDDSYITRTLMLLAQLHCTTIQAYLWAMRCLCMKVETCSSVLCILHLINFFSGGNHFLILLYFLVFCQFNKYFSVASRNVEQPDQFFHSLAKQLIESRLILQIFFAFAPIQDRHMQFLGYIVLFIE